MLPCYRLGEYEVGYTDEEIGLIDGLILSYFTPVSVSEPVREQYYKTHQHIVEDQVGYTDLVNIRVALSFLVSAFGDDRQMEKKLISALAKTNAMLKSVN